MNSNLESPGSADPGHPATSALLAEIAAEYPAWQTQLIRTASTRDSLSQVTLGMAHELNNLVGGISALSEIYIQGFESGLPLKDGLGLINNSASRLQVLLRQLTALNRASDGTRDYVNLAELIQAELPLFTHVLPKTVRVSTSLPTTELAALLDETLLKQVLLNLVLNQRDSLGGERASGTITLELVRLHEGSPRAEVRLRREASEGRESAAEAAAAVQATWLATRLRLLDCIHALSELGGEFELRDDVVTLTLPLIA